MSLVWYRQITVKKFIGLVLKPLSNSEAKNTSSSHWIEAVSTSQMALYGNCTFSVGGPGIHHEIHLTGPLRSSGQGGFRGPAGGRSAFLFSFVHSIDDQKSANIFLYLDLPQDDFRKGVRFFSLLSKKTVTLSKLMRSCDSDEI